ncbi:unique cartilage matrix-associated protein [Eumetopias jubatus]|uniref:unique cartilage matrix-associated protein n=1 Tax=Eumetopias jubatus TaxID=34886 RepID=UPI001016B30B|nr:unique cartilage matrix-associated protein [Eumetopias jubatus]
MAWRRLLMASCLSAAVLLTMLQEGTGASMGTRQVAGQEAQEGEYVEQKIFMQESDASNFLRKRGKRSPKSRDKANVEKRQKLRADELQREYYEEQRNEFENFVEEQNDDGNAPKQAPEMYMSLDKGPQFR